MFKTIIAVIGVFGAVAPEADYIVGRDAAAKLNSEEALAAFIKLAEGPVSVAQKSDALEEASSRALSLARYDEATELAKKIPTPAISKAAQIRILAARRQWRAIVAQFQDENIDAWWPDYLSGEAYFARGRALASAGDGARAVADLRKAADMITYDDNSKGLALIALGIAYRDLIKDDVRAIAAYRETYTTWNLCKRCDAAMGVAVILTRQNKLDEALAELHSIDPAKLDHPYWRGSLLAARGNVLAKQGKKSEAAAQYREALLLSGLHPSQKAAWEEALKELQANGK